MSLPKRIFPWLLCGVVGTAMAWAQAPTSCTSCHGDPEWFDEADVAMVRAVTEGAHGLVGLSCHDCHGGNPAPELADDPDAAMDEGWAPNPYRGAPARTEIPRFCGTCHSDAEYMKRFDPDIRVDQVEEYWTSRHGKALAGGDPNVATCVDCHGTHGILAPDRPESPVHPTRVAETCRTCHADAERMAGYETIPGHPVSTDVYVAWKGSVHARALLEKGDLSAPTCNDCHGNHGAAPPGVGSVSFVCGQCHGREAGLFRETAKQEGFQEHDEFLEGMDGCADCHGDPQASVARVTHFTECATCHENHAIVQPRITMLGPLPETPCAFCHEPLEGSEPPIGEPDRSLRRYEETKAKLLADAGGAGLEGVALFDRLVEDALTLEPHTIPAPEEGRRELRPEFARLFEKFRLGHTSFVLKGEDGKPVRREVSRCLDCHGAEPDMVDEAVGFETSRRMLAMLHQLTAWTARAERITLDAHRGGVQTREAQEAIDRAVDSQIELQVLVHTFDATEGSAFELKHREGLDHARQALEAGRTAIDELRFRHQGLAASLVIILALLVALALKIRDVGGG